MGVMINRRRVCGGGKSMPYDAEIEYLESTGTSNYGQQYIDTLITTKNAFVGIEIDYCIPVYVHDKWVAGYNFYSYGDKAGFQIGMYSNKLSFGIYLNNTIMFGYSFAYNNELHHIILNCNNVGIKVDDYLYTDNQITDFGVNGGNIYLFGRGGNLSKTHFAKCRIGKVKIYKDNTKLVRDFIPVRVGQVGYMYDKISGQLFGNQGTGSFILGSDV